MLNNTELLKNFAALLSVNKKNKKRYQIHSYINAHSNIIMLLYSLRIRIDVDATALHIIIIRERIREISYDITHPLTQPTHTHTHAHHTTRPVRVCTCECIYILIWYDSIAVGNRRKLAFLRGRARRRRRFPGAL